MTGEDSETIDPVDDFEKFWTDKSEGIKNTPISPEKRDEYLNYFNERKRIFKLSISYFDPADGYPKIDDSFFHFASLQEIFEKDKKSKYSWDEIPRKLDKITTSVRFAVNQGEEKYRELEKKHQEEMMKNKKGFFDNVQIFFFTLFGKK